MNNRNDGCKNENINELMSKFNLDWTKAKVTKHLLNKNKFEKRNSNRTKQESL